MADIAIIPFSVDAMNKRLSGRNVWLPGGNPSALPILNIVGGPKIRLGMRNLKEPIPRRAAGSPALPQANHVRNSSLDNFFT